MLIMSTALLTLSTAILTEYTALLIDAISSTTPVAELPMLQRSHLRMGPGILPLWGPPKWQEGGHCRTIIKGPAMEVKGPRISGKGPRLRGKGLGWG